MNIHLGILLSFPIRAAKKGMFSSDFRWNEENIPFLIRVYRKPT